MLVNLPDEAAEQIAADIGSDRPADIGEAAGLLWTELVNPTEMIEDVADAPEVRVK